MQTTALMSRQADKLHCEVCQWRCTLLPDEYGQCLVRQRVGDAIVVHSDSLISAAAVGPIEDYGFRHFFPDAMVLGIGSWGTPFPAHQATNPYALIPQDEAKRRALTPDRVAAFAQERLARGIVVAYNDAVVNYEYLLDILRYGRAGSRFTGMVTGGYWNQPAFDLLAPYLDGINLVLYGFTTASYVERTGVQTWREILVIAEHAVKRWNCHLEITTPIVTGVNDSTDDILGIAGWLMTTFGPHIPWRILPHEEADGAAAQAARTQAQNAGLQFVYGTDVTQATRCPGCGWAVIERTDRQTQLIGVSDSHCDNCNAPLYIRTSLFRRMHH